MKKYLLYISVAALALMQACVQPEHPDFSFEESENIQGLVIKGMLLTDLNTEYESVIDLEAGTAVIQVPYYLSDSKPVQGDLTKMKITATLPKGAKFNPSIAGIHDLAEGFVTTLIYANGKKVELRITADYRKSDAAVLNGLVSAQIVNAVRQPADGANGTLSVLITPSNTAELQKAQLSISPWATFESEAKNADGTIDITQGKDITVVSQSEKVRNTYAIAFETPKTVEYGVGQVKALFGWQPTVSDPRGFTQGGNRTMAVIGNYLILSNSVDFSKMPVYDRFSGEYLPEVKVNTEGIVSNAEIHAITSDDAGHLFAVTYVSTYAADKLPSLHHKTDNQTVYGYLWKDGIENKPTLIMEAAVAGSGWINAPYGFGGTKDFDFFRTVTVCGDLTTGDAIIATMSKSHVRPVFVRFKDGSPQWPAFVQWPSGLPNTAASFWNASKVKPITSDPSALEYFWTSATFRSTFIYAKGNNESSQGVCFDLPDSHWWKYAGGYDYQHPVGSMDYIEFNGAHLLAVMNGTYAQKSVDDVLQMYWRCFVSDIGAFPAASSFVSGFIFDTREGGIDGNSSNFEGSNGVIPTAMISPHAYESGATVLKGNTDQTTDVVFARGNDGMSVQLYFLSTDQGLVGWNLTSLAL